MEGWKKKEAEKSSLLKKQEEENQLLKFKSDQQSEVAPHSQGLLFFECRGNVSCVYFLFCTQDITRLQSELRESLERLKSESRRASEADQHATRVVRALSQHRVQCGCTRKVQAWEGVLIHSKSALTKRTTLNASRGTWD